MNWVVPREDLTPDQLRAMELSPDEHRLVIGGPGSGKTLVMVHRARHLLDTLRVGPDRFRVFVFTNVLTSYIRSALDLLDLPVKCVSTFDSWCREFHQRHVDGPLPTTPKGLDFAAIRSQVLRFVRGNGASTKPYDFVLVDEAQDLSADALEILKHIAWHVTLFADRKQQIYDNGSEEEEIARAFGVRSRSVTLLDGFRCSPYIAALAAVLAGSAQEQAALRAQVRTASGERETPLLHYAASFEAERERLFEILRTRLTVGDNIGILLPQKRQVFGFAKGLQDAGFDVEAQRDSGFRGGSLPALDFASDNPKILTYHSAKGLTFDSVLIPRLVRSSFASVKEARVQRMLFVAITRATKWVYLSTSTHEAFRPVELLVPLKAERALEIQGGLLQKDLLGG